MNTKMMTGLFVLLIIIILISFFLTRQKVETMVLPSQPEPQDAQIDISQQQPLVQAQSFQQAVTLIKVPHKQRKVTDAPAVSKEGDINRTNANASVESSAAGSSAQNGSSAPQQAGITQINKKLPTREQVNEMNSKGIIIF